MNNEIRFTAPWSVGVKIISVLGTALLLGISLIGSQKIPESEPLAARLAATLLPLAVLLVTLPFIVRGYVLTGGELRIERLGWQNHFSLADVVSVEADPDAMRWSLRLFGDGGLFGYFGWFWNRKLGTYRAYGTNPKNTVVLKLSNRTIVITPHDPARFVEEILWQLKPAGGISED
jgi:hypothetical protein